MNNEPILILPASHYWFLWKISWLAFISCIYAISQKHYDLALVPGGVFLTSINYWRKPDYSWRRYMDIGYVHISQLYQCSRAWGGEYAVPYYSLLAIGIVCFPLSIYYKNSNINLSTTLHAMVHIFGNISNIVLYSGKIAKKWF
jgi:hypothetical protein